MSRPTIGIAIAFVLATIGACSSENPRALSRARPVFVLGFDGLDPGLVERFLDEGLLPNLAALKEDGAWGIARSTIPFLSPPAWTTVSTGTEPSDHGIWSFWIRRGNDPRGRWVDSTARLAPAIWQDLSALGHTVGVVNVPVTSPPDSVLGFLVAGMPFPEGAHLAWPRALGEDLEQRGYLREAFEGPPRPGREEEWLDRIEGIAEARRTLGLGLLFERSPDFSFIVFTVADRVQHHLWKFHDPRHPHYRADAPSRLKNAVRDAYVWCDGVLGEVRAHLPDDALLFVVSDHGFGPAYAGITKERALAQWHPDRIVVAGSQNLFGGDFFLETADSTQRHDLVRALEMLETADGARLVRAAYDVRDVPANGFGAELGPDVVALEAEGFLFVPGSPSDSLVTPLPFTSFSGYHRRDGFFAAFGAPVRPGARVTIDVRDVPAWTIHALGEAVPERYTSEIPESPFLPEYFESRDILRAGTATDGLRRPGAATPRDETVAAQLEALGYVR